MTMIHSNFFPVITLSNSEFVFSGAHAALIAAVVAAAAVKKSLRRMAGRYLCFGDLSCTAGSHIVFGWLDCPAVRNSMNSKSNPVSGAKIIMLNSVVAR